MSYLITTDQVNNPILEFNAIKHIAQTTDSKLLLKLFKIRFDQIDASCYQYVYDCIRIPMQQMYFLVADLFL